MNSAAVLGELCGLGFEIVFTGDELSRASGGGFNAELAGDWTVYKDLPRRGSGGSLFNFNVVLHKAEFYLKDPDYDDRVLAKLAKVL